MTGTTLSHYQIVEKIGEGEMGVVYKRHVVYDTAHDVNVKRPEIVRESLDWLDKYLGPVQQ